MPDMSSNKKKSDQVGQSDDPSLERIPNAIE